MGWLRERGLDIQEAGLVLGSRLGRLLSLRRLRERFAEDAERRLNEPRARERARIDHYTRYPEDQPPFFTARTRPLRRDRDEE